MSSGSSSQRSDYYGEVTGFSKKELDAFISAGSLQSSGNVLTTEKPKMKIEEVAYSDEGPIQDRASEDLVSFSQEKLDLLEKTFLSRKQQIQQRRAMPGRAATFLGRS